MKASCIILLLFALSCSNNNDASIPKPQNPPDRTETEPKKDTNRLQGPTDSTGKLRGFIPQKREVANSLYAGFPG